MNKKILNNISTIIDNHYTWNDAKIEFNINDANLERVYIRYIIINYGIDRAYTLLDM